MRGQNKFIRALIATVVVIVTLYLGVVSSRIVKPILNSYGIEKNWAWPTLCILVGVAFSVFVTKRKLSSLKNICLNTLLGFVCGLLLQLLFYLAKQRNWFSFGGITFVPFAFQVYVSWAEEFLFRDRLQAYLQEKMALSVAVVIVSFPFALIHGLNPVLFNNSPFDYSWFVGTFIVSSTAGFLYGRRESFPAAFGVHIGYNIIATFF